MHRGGTVNITAGAELPGRRPGGRAKRRFMHVVTEDLRLQRQQSVTAFFGWSYKQKKLENKMQPPLLMKLKSGLTARCG